MVDILQCLVWANNVKLGKESLVAGGQKQHRKERCWRMWALECVSVLRRALPPKPPKILGFQSGLSRPARDRGTRVNLGDWRLPDACGIRPGHSHPRWVECSTPWDHLPPVDWAGYGPTLSPWGWATLNLSFPGPCRQSAWEWWKLQYWV